MGSIIPSFLDFGDYSEYNLHRLSKGFVMPVNWTVVSIIGNFVFGFYSIGLTLYTVIKSNKEKKPQISVSVSMRWRPKYLDSRVGSEVLLITVTFHSQAATQAGEVRERFEVVVENTSHATDHVQSSRGERRCVDVIVLLALHDLIIYQSGIDVNIQIFDEVCGNLDSDGIERLIELLRERAEERCTYVITHDRELGSEFENYIMVEKDEHGVSRIGTVGTWSG